MSNDEQDLIVGRTIREHTEAVRLAGALRAEARRIAEALTSISNHLKEGPLHDDLDAEIACMPTREELQKLVAEIRDAKRRQEELRASVEELGLRSF